ncbi:MAG TPA: hypothetical protein VI837_11300 [Blastocatellia bacterium]|nr:hypothetical protein [Blastocatellia bacterium]
MKKLVTFRSPFTRLNASAPRLAWVTALIVLNAVFCAGQGPPNTDGWVVLPVDDYRALRLAAFPAERQPDPTPVEATLTRVDYELKVDGEIALGEARLTIDVIKDGWVRVAIPAGLMIRQARLDGRPVSLITNSEKGTAASYVLLSRTGRSVLTLGLVARVSSVAGTEMLKLPVGTSAISRAAVVVARQGVDARITGGLLLEKSETATESRWVAYGRGSEALTFAWRRRIDDQRATQPLRLRGAITQLVGLGEDTTQINAEVQVDVLQGLAKEVRLRLPDQFTVNQVSGAMVADWDSSAPELVVTFLEPVAQSTRFTVTGELKLPRDGQIDVPLVRLTAAERETGAVGVEVLGAAEIKDRKSAGLDEADAADLAQLISSRQSPSLIAFRMRPAEGKSQRSLSLNIARYTPQAVLTANVEEARYSVLVTEDGKMLVHSRLAVRNNQRNFLKINLPSTAVLWSALVAGRPVRPGRAPDGSLLVPLEKGRTGEEAPAFVVELAYLDRVPAWAEKGRARLSLLTLDMPISKSGVLIHHSPIFRLTPMPGNFRSAAYEAPSSAALRSASVSTAGAETPGAGPAVSSTIDATEALVSRLHKAGAGSRPMRILPPRVTFPHFGPSIFLVSELTGENQSPVVEVDFQRDKKRGER